MLCVCAVKEGHNLSAGTQVVRGEGQGACAARDAQGDGPGDRRGAVARFRNVRVAAVRVARGRARRAPEEVTACALVQAASGEKCFASVPEAMPFLTAQRTAAL